MEIVVLWFVFSAIVGAIASNKGRSGIGFFLLALLLSPLIGLIAALIVSPNTQVTEKAAIDTGQQRKCPFCAELVKSEAIVCKHCGRDIPAQERKTTLCQACGTAVPAGEGMCLSCGKST